MKNAKELILEYTAFSFRDPKKAAEMFAEDGAFEMPYLATFGLPPQYKGHDAIAGFFQSVLELLAMYAAAPRIPLALLVLGAIYKQAAPALLILGALAGTMQLLDVGIGLFQHDLRKWVGPLFFAVLQFFVVYLLHISVRITP